MSFLIESSRLYLREFIFEDASFLFELNNDPEVIKYTGNTAFKSVEEARQFISNYDQYARSGFGRWTVLTKKNSKTIGWCGLKYLEESKEVDLGFRFLKSECNQGYATESSIAVLKYAKTVLGLRRIIGRAVKENTASIRVLEKIGMKYVKDCDFDGLDGVLYEFKY